MGKRKQAEPAFHRPPKATLHTRLCVETEEHTLSVSHMHAGARTCSSTIPGSQAEAKSSAETSTCLQTRQQTVHGSSRPSIRRSRCCRCLLETQLHPISLVGFRRPNQPEPCTCVNPGRHQTACAHTLSASSTKHSPDAHTQRTQSGLNNDGQTRSVQKLLHSPNRTTHFLPDRHLRMFSPHQRLCARAPPCLKTPNPRHKMTVHPTPQTKRRYVHSIPFSAPGAVTRVSCRPVLFSLLAISRQTGPSSAHSTRQMQRSSFQLLAPPAKQNAQNCKQPKLQCNPSHQAQLPTSNSMHPTRCVWLCIYTQLNFTLRTSHPGQLRARNFTPASQ
jgi:hypothetical protein